MTYGIYEAYVAANWGDIQAGKPIVCEVQSVEEGITRVVKAQIAQSAAALPGADILRLKTDEGAWKEEKWAIKIVEELDPDEVVLTPLPIKLGAERVYGPPPGVTPT